MAQVFYLSDTEAQFDNLKLETVPMDQEKLPQKLSVLFFVLFFTAFLILDIQTEFYFNTPPSTAWNLPKYNPLWLTEFIWMLTHPTPSSNSHTAFIFLQLKMFACVCVCVFEVGSMSCFIIWMTCTSFKYYVILVEGIKKDGENRDSEAHDLFQILLISIKLPVSLWN